MAAESPRRLLTPAAHAASDPHAQIHTPRFLIGTGIVLLGLVNLYNQVLPRLDGTADSAFSVIAPWGITLPVPTTAPGSSSEAIMLSLVLLGAIALTYVAGLSICRGHPGNGQTLTIVLAVSILAGLAMVAVPPTENADLDYYAFEGRMIVRDGRSPYAVAPAALSDDAWFPALSPTWRDLTTGYGPSWLAITAGIDLATDRGGGLLDLARTLTAFRLLFIVLGTLNALLIWLILGSLAPRRRLIGTLAYAWNPVVVISGVEHNDTAMLFLALLGIWLQLRGSPHGATVSLTLSALIKYLTGPLLIAYLVWHWRRGERQNALRLAALAGGTTILTFLPFQPVAFVSHLPTYLESSGRLDHVDQVSLAVMASIVIGAVLAVSFPRRLEQAIIAGVLILFAYLVALSRDWFPWYVVGAVGLAAILGGRWLDVAATSGVAWLFSAHQGSADLAGLAQSHLGLTPNTTVTILFFGPAVLAGLVGVAGQRSDRPGIRGLVVGIGIITVLALGVPITSNWSSPPALADLGGGRWPGPQIFDSALEWDNWSWGTRVEQIGTPVGPGGVRSLCMTFQSADAAFFAHHPHFATNGYQTLSFSLRPSSQSVPLVVSVRNQSGQTIGSVPLAPVMAQAPLPDGWRIVRIPLSDLHADHTVLTGVLLQPSVPAPTETICVQGVTFQ